MMRSIALFALLSGASALESVDILAKTSELLEKKLASFEKKDLKDIEVYENYVQVREEAKKAAAALEVAQNEIKEFAPAPVLDASVKRLALDLEEADNIQEWKIETQQQPQLNEQQQEEAVDTESTEELDEKKAEEILYAEEDTMFEEGTEVEESPLLLAQQEPETIALYKKQVATVEKKDEKKEEKKDEKKEEKKDGKKLKSWEKARNLMKKQQEEFEVKREERHHEMLKNFQSPYREASKTDQQVEVKEEGHGNYGKFKSLILNSFAEGAGPLEDVMAKREKELEQEAIIHQKATNLAKRAMRLCEGDHTCQDKVQKKLKDGAFDKEIKGGKTELKVTKTLGGVDLKVKSKDSKK